MYIKKHSRVAEGYKKIVLGFVIVTVLLVGIILYFSASRAVIKVQPIGSSVETDFVSDVVSDGAVEGSALQGVLFETEVEGAGNGVATGTMILEGNAIGKVTLINQRADAQSLVKTTRLLTADGILIRLMESVNIPANGQLEADVYADDPNSFDELQPTKFTIPGLWEGLQSQVFAESKGVLKSTGDSVKIIQDADIKKAKTDLTEVLYNKGIEEFKKQLPSMDYVTLVVSKTVVEETVDAEVGAQQDTFEVSSKLQLVMIGLDPNKVVEMAGDRLQQVVPQGQELLNLSMDKFSYKVQNFDNEKKTANVKVHVAGEAVIKADSQIFQKDKMVGLSPKGVELYLANYSEIESVSVELSPFWVKKVPKLKDHINIVIVNTAD
ncbi:hypothetical protein HQ571_03125 [Candidatus Kuenenbacteria bacterium]|nr:hypothetical protein [Candidatus Kuenenbacteria bacterium]